jgi:hypothetical protein
MNALLTLMNLIKTNFWIRYVALFISGALLTFLVLPSAKYSDKEISKQKNDIKISYQAQIDQKEKDYQQLRASSKQEIDKISQELIANEQSYKIKMSSLSSENKSLRKSSEKITIETRYPDGRIEKRTVSRSQAESESQRISQIQQESDKKLKQTVDRLSKEYSLKLDKLQSSYEEEKNQWISELSQMHQALKNEQDKVSQLTINDRKFGLALGKTGYTTDALGEYNFYGPLFVGSMIELNSINYTYNSSGIFLGVRF